MAFINTQIWKDFISLFYPRICFVCDNSLVATEQYICTHCLLDLPKYDINGPDASLLANRFAAFPDVTMAWSFMEFYKNGPAQKLLHKLKYEGQPTLGEYLGQLLAHDLRRLFPEAVTDVDVVVPIPIHKSKVSLRGYNQSEKIVEGMNTVLNFNYDCGSLIRSKRTDTQTKKSKAERYENVKGVYKITNPDAFTDQHVLIVDDVITTGATVSMAIEALLECGARKISVACLATER